MIDDTPNSVSVQEFKSLIRVENATYTVQLDDPDSPEYRALETRFCSQVNTDKKSKQTISKQSYPKTSYPPHHITIPTLPQKCCYRSRIRQLVHSLVLEGNDTRRERIMHFISHKQPVCYLSFARSRSKNLLFANDFKISLGVSAIQPVTISVTTKTITGN